MSFIYDHYKIPPRLGEIDFEKCTAIDFGCGDYRSDVAKQVLQMPFKKLTSIEGYKVDFDNMPTGIAAEHEKIFANVVDVLPTLKGKYDVAFAFDVIEHLEKEEGIKLLKWMDKHVTKRIVIFVPEEPVGFHRIWNDGNVLQEHISYWNAEDFEKLGYTVERMEKIHSDVQDGQTIRFDALWVTKSPS
jgi:hypothetical protein